MIRDKIKKMYLKFFFLVILLSCESTEKAKNIYNQNVTHSIDSKVEVIQLSNSTFYKELISNGKLVSANKNNLYFKINSEIKQIMVKNGDHIQKGQNVATLDQFEFLQQYETAENNLTKSLLEFKDILLSQGYKLEDSIKLPKDIYKMASLRSGYSKSKIDFITNEHNLKNCTLKAPFGGKIANLKYKKFERVNIGDVFCMLIDDSEFEVEFYIIESEFKDVKLNDKVMITTFSTDKEFEGVISEINPLVNADGLILIKAKVINLQGKLIEGMNVKVFVRKQFPNRLIVPKSAVLIRNNNEVIFKFEKGKAIWVYIDIEMENGDFYSVINEKNKKMKLTIGDTIITSGNLTLGHESKVVIR